MNDYWFKPHRYGLGATPSTWEGWAVVAGYVALVVWESVAMLRPSAPHGAAFLAVVGIETAALIFITARKTDGEWRWRWGKD